MSMRNRVTFAQHYTGPADMHDDYGRVDIGWCHTLMSGGRITVLDRMTGFGWRDIETGYRSPCGQFWLASGSEDIRRHLDEFNSEDEMVAWVMGRANNCRGGRNAWTGYPKNRVMPECFA